MGRLSRWVWGVLLCLIITSNPGSSADSDGTTNFALAIEITNETFNVSLLNPESESSKRLDTEVTKLLDGIYNCSNCGSYGGVECITYSHGLIANAIIIFNTDLINEYIVHALFMGNIATALLQTNLSVNKTYASASMPVLLDKDTCKKTTTTSEPTTTPGLDTTTVLSKTLAHINNTDPTKSPDHTNSTDPTNNPNPTVTSDSANAGGTSDPSSGGGNHDDRDWVPGWGIALLVLAAAILLLLIIIFILLCVHYCRKRPSEDPMGKNPDPYNEQNKMPPQETVPVLYPSLPTAEPSDPMKAQMIVDDQPKKNRTGFYAVNP